MADSFCPGHWDTLNNFTQTLTWPKRCHTDIAAFLYFMLLLALRFWSEKTRFMCTVPQAPPQKSSSELPTTEESIQTLPGTTRGGGSLSCGGLQQDQKWCSDSSGSFWPSLGLLEQGFSHLGRTLLRQYLLWNSLWHCFFLNTWLLLVTHQHSKELD